MFELKDLRKTKTKNRKLEASGSKMGGAGVPLKWVLLLVSLSPRELHHCQMAEAGLTAPAPGQAQVFHEVRAKAVATGEVHQAVAWPGETTKRAWRKRGGKLVFFVWDRTAVQIVLNICTGMSTPTRREELVTCSIQDLMF